MVVLIAGRIGDGKDTLAKIIMEELEMAGFNSYIARFADMPKRHCADIVGVDAETFNDHDHPNKAKYRSAYRDHAEILKQVYGHDVWAKALANQYRKEGGNMITPDVRFQHEIDAFNGENAIVIRVKRLATLEEWSKSYGEELLELPTANLPIKYSSEDLLGIVREYNVSKVIEMMEAPSEMSVDSLQINNDSVIWNETRHEMRVLISKILMVYLK